MNEAARKIQERLIQLDPGSGWQDTGIAGLAVCRAGEGISEIALRARKNPGLLYLQLKDRIYVCPVCGHVIDRDLNASINLADCYINQHDLVQG